MKRMKFVPAVLIAGLCAFSACSDDENGEVFSNLTTEEHKAKLEGEGIAFAKNMDAVADLKVYDVVDAFFTLKDQENQNVAMSPAIAFGVDQINALRNGAKSSVNLKALSVDGTNSASAEFAAEAGIYKWDGTKFAHTPKEGEITYIFTVEGKEAKFSVNNFTVKKAVNQIETGVVIELPLSLNMSVTLGDVALCSYVFTGEWYENDTPKLLKEDIKLEGFTFTHELSNTKAVLSMGSSFDYNETIIFANNISIEGNVDYSEIMAQVKAAETNGPNDALNQEILTKANAWFQVGNVKADGVVDVKGIMNTMKSGLETVDMQSDDAMNTLLVEAANQNVKLFVRYADSNEIIAKSEFYLNTYKDTEWVQGADGSWGEVPATFTEPDIRMVFGDNSAVDGDFFNNGFGDMFKQIDALVKRVEANFAEETPAQ